MFNAVWFIAGVVLGIAGTIGIYQLYEWIRKLSNRVESLRNRLSHYQRMEQDWIEFQFTKKKSN